ncbi:MAG: UDP-N-acetylmuramoyl-L-alanyl-D-glutamate--2,6-diaminopimelate ligase [Clostridiales bacterium]|nr:UDP-N-acetylmuramoyl-L-alanyl-D-glutamate--2,6-diaminopimelate ligase [Clostridiales bacterium]
MKLSALLKKVNILTMGASPDVEITSITDNSAKVVPGCAFVCIEGKRFDGHTVAAEAVKNGASAVIACRDTGLDCQVLTSDTRAAYALMCSAWYGDPAEKLKIIGVTGTNGKTTTCFILREMLSSFGKKTGLIGTVKNMAGEKEFPSSLTTPDPMELYSLFSIMVEEGCEYCVMEASSQALAQKRLEGIRFTAAIFTNLTEDHLDYHETFENYVAAKHMLFENADLAVVNYDDGYMREIIKDISCPVKTFSAKKDEADYTAKNIQVKSSGTEYELVAEGMIGRVKFGIPGTFSVYNSMGAIVCLTELGFPFSETVAASAKTKGVPGRIEVVPTDTDFTVIIDYAHTPDGLQNILETVNEIAEGKVITVFGCGGDRDKSKRPIMGRIAVGNSDMVIVTSDNPRTEDPEKIIDDIMTGIDKPKIPVYRICDRTDAIKKALKKARTGDIVLLAGKGHETYQILGTEKIHYDEREKVAGLLKEPV